MIWQAVRASEKESSSILSEANSESRAATKAGESEAADILSDAKQRASELTSTADAQV